MTPISTVTIFVALHPWCHDERRDIAVRAAEDGRDGPLPTLGEAIGMIPKIGSGSSAFGHENKGDSMTKSDRQAADYRAEASERAAPNGLRTERVVLEVTYDQEKQGHPGTWDWSTMVLDEGESVRVVEEDREAADRVSREEGYRVLLSEIIAAREERDAANREREELNQQAKKALAHSDKMWLACLAVGGERDKLQARGSELESQLESVADRAAAAETALESAPAATGGDTNNSSPLPRITAPLGTAAHTAQGPLPADAARAGALLRERPPCRG
jgi:hypothetical protein